MNEITECPDCEGSGVVGKNTCPECFGKGWVYEDKEE